MEEEKGSSHAEEVEDVLLSDADYMIWKSNTPLLYDWLLHHNSEWPSLSAWWGPVITPPPGASSKPKSFVQRMYLSTRTGSFVRSFVRLT